MDVLIFPLGPGLMVSKVPPNISLKTRGNSGKCYFYGTPDRKNNALHHFLHWLCREKQPDFSGLDPLHFFLS